MNKPRNYKISWAAPPQVLLEGELGKIVGLAQNKVQRLDGCKY